MMTNRNYSGSAWS